MSQPYARWPDGGSAGDVAVGSTGRAFEPRLRGASRASQPLVLGRGRHRFAHLHRAVCTRAIADAVASAGLVRRCRRLWLPALVARGYEAVSLLSWRGHVAVIAASLLLAVAIARFLAAETQAAWPHLDASTMVLSLFATWLTVRGKLENWLYWIAVDAVQAWLYTAQGLVFTAFLFLVYLVIASVGFIEWSKTYRRQTVG